MNKKNRTKNKCFSIILYLILLLYITGCESVSNDLQPESTDASVMTIDILQLGKADAIIINNSGYTAVIDCGELDNGKKVVSKLNKLGIDKIDYLIITHFDKDHVGGASDVINSFRIDNILEPSYIPGNPDSEEYTSYRFAIVDKGIAVTALNKDYSFSLGNMSFNIMTTNGTAFKKNIDNNNSLMISIEHAGNSFLLAGDVEKERINEILKSGIGTFDFLKVPHHGSYNSASDAFFNTISPKYAAITCSDKNPADTKVIEALENLQCSVFLTSNGELKVISTVNGIKILQ